MLRVGLTGGIATGKSTVVAMLRELGCHVLEADKMAHEIIAPGRPAYDEVVGEFGSAILRPDGFIERPRLAALVFHDPARLARLNAIIHPRVLAECDHQLERLERSDPHGIAVIEAALLIEARHHERLDRLAVVFCTPEQQIERLTDPAYGRAMPREQAEGRIAAQMDPAEKLKIANDIIDCSGTLEETRRQVDALVERWKQLARSR